MHLERRGLQFIRESEVGGVAEWGGRLKPVYGVTNRTPSSGAITIKEIERLGLFDKCKRIRDFVFFACVLKDEQGGENR
jgi:hypothetical protein